MKVLQFLNFQGFDFPWDEAYHMHLQQACVPLTLKLQFDIFVHPTVVFESPTRILCLVCNVNASVLCKNKSVLTIFCPWTLVIAVPQSQFALEEPGFIKFPEDN